MPPLDGYTEVTSARDKLVHDPAPAPGTSDSEAPASSLKGRPIVAKTAIALVGVAVLVLCVLGVLGIVRHGSQASAAKEQPATLRRPAAESASAAKEQPASTLRRPAAESASAATTEWPATTLRPAPAAESVVMPPAEEKSNSSGSCSASGKDCRNTQCCQGEGLQCYEKADDWAGCLAVCSDKNWTCKELGKRTPLKNPGCSKLGENCLLTQCCELQGTQCYQKSDFWATCGYACDPTWGYWKGYSCNEIGPRQPERCTWSGGACTYAKKCCHAGASCYSRNPVEAYCSNRPDRDVPASWNGTVLGGSMYEWQVPPVEKKEDAKGSSLFCMMAVLPGSPEEQLSGLAKSKGASIYACDANMITNSAAAPMKQWGSGDTTLVNTESFLDVWRQVKTDGRYKNYDWTVKVDPDSVFMPDRLKYHLEHLLAPKNMPIYIKNTAKEFGFLGAIEVFSKEAMDVYFGKDTVDDNDQHCFKETSSNAGEDGFMKGCMDMLGAGYMLDVEVLNNPAETNCGIGSRVTFHAFKDVGKWEACYNQAVAR